MAGDSGDRSQSDWLYRPERTEGEVNKGGWGGPGCGFWLMFLLMVTAGTALGWVLVDWLGARGLLDWI